MLPAHLRALELLPADTEEARPREHALRRSDVLRQGLVVADVSGAALAGAVASLTAGLEPVRSLALTAGLIAFWPLAMLAFGLYSVDGMRTWASGIRQAPRLCAAALLVSWPLEVAIATLGGSAAPAEAVLATGVLAGASVALRAVTRALAHVAKPLRQRALVVGSGIVAGQVVSRLRTNEQLGVDAVGIVDDGMSDLDTSGLPLVGRIGDVPRLIEEESIDRVIIAFSRASHHELLDCIRACRERGVAVDVVPRLFEFMEGAMAVDTIRGLPLLSLETPTLSRSARVVKRALDIAVSALMLGLLWPLMLWIAVAIKLDSPGPVLFRQRRAGRDGKPFEVVKFRTMYIDAEERKRELLAANDVRDGVMFKMWHDPRVTRLGRRLRRLSLDELPQLVNVLRGEMSLVGPRPLVFEEAKSLAETWHVRRLELSPGLTGPWQVAGRNHVSFQDMLRLDYQYVASWSLARDLEILVATIPAVLSRRGAF